jgi:PAS domain S-box-containing protein
MVSTPTRILLIEDNPGDIRLIREMLVEARDATFHLQVAEWLSGGLAYLAERSVDLILLDLGLPDSSGLETFRRVYAQASGVPIVVLSVSDDDELALQAVQAGAQDYLVKGHVDSYLIVRAIRYAIERKRAEDALRQARDELETRVQERTAELAAANTALRAEIAERRQVERTRRESEERFRLLVEAVRDYALIMLDVDGRIISWNAGAERIYGYSLNDIVGQHVSWLYPADERSSGKPGLLLHMAAIEGRVEVEGWRVRRDGTRFWANAVVTAIRDEAGQPRGYAKVTRDITERRRLEEQLRQAQKMEAVGRLAGGIAHDFNNWLTVIVSYLELLLEDMALDSPLRRYAEDALEAADRAASLTRQLLAFSRRQVLQPQELDLNAVVAGMEPMLQRLMGEDVTLITSLDPTLGRITADPGQVEQVILNLAVNARDAMPRGGRLSLETANVELDDTYARRQLDVKAGSYVMLTVSDSGVGMDAKTLSHIFEPFFTTKEPGKGTGLGLSIVYGIVTQNGGHIEVDSEPGRGATFSIYFPRVQGHPPVGAQGVARTATRRGGETVLLVEDEVSVRLVTREVLLLAGYQVLEASGGEEAVRLCEQHAGPIHLLLTDVVMPVLSGPELAQRLVQMRPEMKVLYMSGYSEDIVTRYGTLEISGAFLQKPFRPAALQDKVREVLEADPAAPTEPDV